jgi:rubredoxin-NAD+ reductase
VRSFVIVGSGFAGYTAARDIRRRDKDSRITMVTSDHGSFYSKPALSNLFSIERKNSHFRVTSAAEMERELSLRVLANTAVRAIHPASCLVETEEGLLQYSELVLAVGASARPLSVRGDAHDSICYVNDLESSIDFKARLHVGCRITIVGAGLVGCEFANDLAAAGWPVDVVDIAEQPLATILPPRCGQYVRDRLEGIGVRFHMGRPVDSIERTERGLSIALQGGAVLDAHVVLGATGLLPRVDLAKAAGLRVSRAIVVDSHLRTSNGRIYALGDCAEVLGSWRPFISTITMSSRALVAAIFAQVVPVQPMPRMITLKTPACPVVAVLRDRSQGVAEWTFHEGTEGLQALVRDSAGRLCEYVLCGSEVTRHPELFRTVAKPNCSL